MYTVIALNSHQMNKFWISILSLCILVPLTAQELKTSVKTVTAYRSEAFVQREGRVSLNAGEQEIMLSGLPDEFDINSIRISSRPPIRILDIRPERRTMEHDSLKSRSVKLEKSYSTLVADHKSLKTELEILKTEERVLMQNTSYGGQQSGLTSTQLQQNMSFLGSQLRSLREKMAIKEKEIDNKLSSINRIKNQINTLRGKRGRIERVIEVKADVETTGSYTIEVKYQHPSSGWRPFYELKAGKLNEPITLTEKGMVHQQSGEDWENIKLTLSTAEPRKGNSPPVLSPIELQLGVPYYPRRNPAPQYIAPNMADQLMGIVYERQTGEAIAYANVMAYGSKGTMVASTTTAEDGSFSLSAKAGIQRFEVSFIGYYKMSFNVSASSLYFDVAMSPQANVLDEVVISSSEDASYTAISEDVIQNTPSRGMASKGVQTQFSQVVVNKEPTNLQYSIKKPQDISSNGQEVGVVMRELSIPVHYTHMAYPEFEEKAFLFAYIPDWEKINLLSGEAALYIQDQYLGKTLIDTKVMSDSLTIALGRDDALQTSREAIKSEQNKSLFGSSIKEKMAYKITLKNNKSEEVSVQVFDRIPISRNPEIEVEVDDLNNGKLQEATGEIEWNVKIPAGQSIEIVFSYSVKYPKGKVINLPR
jgi:hypothetical protein